MNKSIIMSVIGMASDMAPIKDKDVSTVTEFESLGYDSLSFIEFLVEVEGAMGIEFSDEMLDFKLYTTVGDVINEVSSLMDSLEVSNAKS